MKEYLTFIEIGKWLRNEELLIGAIYRIAVSSLTMPANAEITEEILKAVSDIPT